MKKIFKHLYIDEVSNTLTNEGFKTLNCLEATYNPKYSKIRNKYPDYSDIEKLEYLFARNEREKRVPIVPPSEKKVPVDFVSLLASKPEIEWLEMDIGMMEKLEQILKSYLMDLKAAMKMILEDRFAKELSSLYAQRSEIDSKILEIQNAQAALHEEAA